VDIYTIIFLALAVFIFLRLRNVLGQRTGNERPPFDRTARNVVQGAQDNNVVPMPGAVIDQAPLAPTADVAPPLDRWKGLAEPGTPLAQGLDAIAPQDPSFDPRHFLSGARSAYEMIVLAFANGDRRALKDLLSPEVYESYLKGRFIFEQGNRPALEESIHYFEGALNRDATFAPAYVGLADAYTRLGTVFAGESPETTRPKVMSYARKALEFDATA